MLRRLALPFRRLRQDERGAMIIETALVAPMLAILALAGFEASRIVARQTELQSAVSEAASIVRAVQPETLEERNTIRDVMAVSAGLGSEDITITEVYRCGTSANYVTSESTCGTDPMSTYIRVNVSTSYTPKWKQYGIGSTIDYNIERTVLIG